MEVKAISAEDTYNIRQEVLRPGYPIDSCHFDGDHDEQTFHLGAFVDGRLVSIASFYFDRSDKIQEENQYRLRGMATLPNFRGLGLSKALLSTGFPLIKQNFCSHVWCNARKSAVGFYESTGFEGIGEYFEIENVGTHLLMAKKIN